MSRLRFQVGATILCNMGPDGWQLGRVVALHYREDHWPPGRNAPYQVALEADHTLIYVPEDDDRYCREATQEDLNIARRLDALAAMPTGSRGVSPQDTDPGTVLDTELACSGSPPPTGNPNYRTGRCHCCDCCPRNWSAVELYSEHYRCAARNGLKVTRHAVDLGTVRVGTSLRHAAGGPTREGFLQCPTLTRLPPGLRFSDDGALAGEVRFDPHRADTYRVDFVAVSTADWDDPQVGLVRLELSLQVEGNVPPDDFDMERFEDEQGKARAEAKRRVRDLVNVWLEWEQGDRSNRETCDSMLAELRELRALLERYPRLDGGRWWAQLGGFHMNVHKLLENTLFECELYLGHALTFGEPEVRQMAEQNLQGCYRKRILEAARFMWIDGLGQMMRGEWAPAADTLRRAATKMDGWGWAVNNGDIWISEAAARLIHGAQIVLRDATKSDEAARWISEAAACLELGQARAAEGELFGTEGHPWGSEVEQALAAYRRLHGPDEDAEEWLAGLKRRNVYWCAQVLGGAWPFPPQPRPRLEDAATLVARLPGHNP